MTKMCFSILNTHRFNIPKASHFKRIFMHCKWRIVRALAADSHSLIHFYRLNRPIPATPVASMPQHLQLSIFLDIDSVLLSIILHISKSYFCCLSSQSIRIYQTIFNKLIKYFVSGDVLAFHLRLILFI